MRIFQRRFEVFSEWDLEVSELCCKAIVELVLGFLGEVDCWLVAVVVEVTSCYETVAACISLEDGLVNYVLTSGPLFPGPQTTNIFFPLLGGCTR